MRFKNTSQLCARKKKVHQKINYATYNDIFSFFPDILVNAITGNTREKRHYCPKAHGLGMNKGHSRSKHRENGVLTFRMVLSARCARGTHQGRRASAPVDMGQG